MSSATAQAAAEGLPMLTDLAPYLLTKDDFARLSQCELYEVAAILRAASDMLAYSRHAGLLDEISGTLVSLARDARDVAEAHKPVDQAEANWRGWHITAHAAHASEPLSHIAVYATQAASTERYAPVTR